jgi:hypothetical protein
MFNSRDFELEKKEGFFFPFASSRMKINQVASERDI